MRSDVVLKSDQVAKSRHCFRF